MILAVTSINDDMQTFFVKLKLGGACTTDQLASNLTEHQIRDLKENGILEPKTHTLKRTTLKKMWEAGAVSDETYYKQKANKIPSLTVYKVSSKGRRFAKKALRIENMHSSNTIWHDVRLFSKTETLSAAELKSAKSESEIRAQLKIAFNTAKNNSELMELHEKKIEELSHRLKRPARFATKLSKNNPEGSPLDLVYRSDKTGEWIGYEVVTRSYTEYDRCVKELSAFVLNYTYQEEAI